ATMSHDSLLSSSRVPGDRDSFPTRRSSDLGQGPLHALHLVYDDLLHLAAGGIQDGAERHPGEFLQDLLPDGLQNGKGSLVGDGRSEEHTSELQSRFDIVCRLLLEKKKQPTL